MTTPEPEAGTTLGYVIGAAGRAADEAAGLRDRMTEHRLFAPWPPRAPNGPAGGHRELLAVLDRLVAGLEDTARQAAVEPELRGAAQARMEAAANELAAYRLLASQASGALAEQPGEFGRYVVTSPQGRRYWHADDPEHAAEQHRRAYPGQPVISVRPASDEPQARADAFDTAVALFGRLLSAPSSGLNDAALRARELRRLASEAGEYHQHLPRLARDLGISPGTPLSGVWNRLENAVGLITGGISEMATALAELSGLDPLSASEQDILQALAGQALTNSGDRLARAEHGVRLAVSRLNDAIDMAHSAGTSPGTARDLVTSQARLGPLGRRYLDREVRGWDDIYEAGPRPAGPGDHELLALHARPRPALWDLITDWEQAAPGALARAGAELAQAEIAFYEATSRFDDAADLAQYAGIGPDDARDLVTAHFITLGDEGREYVTAEIAGWDTSPPHDLADEMADGTEPATFWEVARSARAAKGAGDYGTAAVTWLLARDLLPADHPLRGGLDRLIAALRDGTAHGGHVTRDGRLLPVEAAVIPAAPYTAGDGRDREPGAALGRPGGVTATAPADISFPQSPAPRRPRLAGPVLAALRQPAAWPRRPGRKAP